MVSKIQINILGLAVNLSLVIGAHRGSLYYMIKTPHCISSLII